MKKYLLIFLILLFLPSITFADPSDWYVEYRTESNGPIGYHPDLDRYNLNDTFLITFSDGDWTIDWTYPDDIEWKGKLYNIDNIFEVYEWARKKMEFEESGGDLLIINPEWVWLYWDDDKYVYREYSTGQIFDFEPVWDGDWILVVKRPDRIFKLGNDQDWPNFTYESWSATSNSE